MNEERMIYSSMEHKDFFCWVIEAVQVSGCLSCCVGVLSGNRQGYKGACK